MEHFYMYLNHTDSKHLYPNNRPDNFTIHLPQSLVLDGDWSVGLWDLRLKAKGTSRQDSFIFCDAVDTSYVQGWPLKIIKRVTLKPKYTEIQFNPVQYFKYDNTIKRDTLQFSISEASPSVTSSLEFQQVTYTLHFKRTIPS